VKTARKFNEYLEITGIVLTKLDGDARGGAALSICSVTGKPIKFISVGEKVSDLEIFHPERITNRILGMGDVVTLVEKAEEVIDRKKSQRLEEKILKSEFNLQDFLDQLQQIKRMGPLQQLVEMLPMGKMMKGIKFDDDALIKVEAIINSMTQQERNYPKIIEGSRKRRIARGSGTRIEDVNRLLKQFFQMQKMLKYVSRMSGKKTKQFAKHSMGFMNFN